MANALPDPVRAALWSYDTEHMDLVLHAERIITNVLNIGTHEAVQWLFVTYDRSVISSVVEQPRPGEWNRKSLNFWSLLFDVEPRIRTRF